MLALLSHSLVISLQVTKVTSSKLICKNVTVSLMLKEFLDYCWTVIICEKPRNWMLC